MRKILPLMCTLILLVSCQNKQQNVNAKTKIEKEVLYAENDRVLKIDINYTEQGKLIYFSGATNLPNGTKIGISLTDEKGFNAQDFDIYIENYKYRSHGFSSKGEKIIGNYKVTIFSYFNSGWQKEELLESLKEYNGNLIQEENDNIFGTQKFFEIKSEITFGSKELVEKKKHDCNAVYEAYDKILYKIEKETLELENIYKNNDKESFEILVAARNRKTSSWSEQIRKKINSDCCSSAKSQLTTVTIQLGLLGLAYAQIYEKGDKNVKNRLKDLNESIFEAHKFIVECKE